MWIGRNGDVLEGVANYKLGVMDDLLFSLSLGDTKLKVSLKFAILPDRVSFIVLLISRGKRLSFLERSWARRSGSVLYLR